MNGIVEEGDIENYCSEEKFDLVYSFGVLHHTPNTQKAVNNIYNLLKPGGTFKLMLYAKNSWKYFCIKDGLDRYEAQSGVPIADVYSYDDVYNLTDLFAESDADRVRYRLGSEGRMVQLRYSEQDSSEIDTSKTVGSFQVVSLYTKNQFEIIFD